MNILIVNDFGYINGGTAQVALLSAFGLAEAGHQVTFLTAVGPFDETYRHPKITVICTDQYEIVADPHRARAAWQGMWNGKAARAMARLLDGMDRSHTLVHLHGWTKALSASVIREAVLRNFSIVATLHDYFAACPNGGFFNYQTRQICRLDPLSRQCVSTHCDARGYSQKIWRVARQVIAHKAGLYPSGVRNFITISDISQAALSPYLPDNAVFHRIPNPSMPVKNTPVDVAANRRFTYVGRLAPEKGSTLFAQAAHRAGVAAEFIGDGVERDAVLAACPDARVTGWISSAEVQGVLRRARALVLPSLWYEGQPLVVGEAAAQGIPAIVPDTCAAREAVADGETGLWFKCGDAADLAAKIRMLESDGLVAAMGAAAYRRFWQDPFTVDKHVAALERAYLMVLANNVEDDIPACV